MTPGATREVVTAAFPFVPAELSIAHFASTYLPADVHCRIRRMLGHHADLVCGIDIHSIRASLDGRTREGMEPRVARFEAEYRRQMEVLDIALDVFERTDHPAHLQATEQALRGLEAGGLVCERSREVWHCLGCDAYPPLRMTLPPGTPVRSATPARCPFCSADRFEQVHRSHLDLRLDPRRERLGDLNQQINPPAARSWVANILEEPLADWNFTRDNLVGVPIEGRPTQSMYLWFESLLGYLSMAGLRGEGQRPTLQFHGKNIIWHHSILWPVLLEDGLGGDATLTRNSIRGFQDLANSSRELVDLDLAAPSFPCDYLRFYLVLSVPMGLTDFGLEVGDMRRVCNTQLCQLLGNFLRRATLALEKRPGARRSLSPEAPLWQQFRQDVVPEIEQACIYGDVRSATQTIVEYGRSLNRMMQHEQLYKTDAPEAAAKLAFGIASLLTLLAPVVPTLAREANPFAGWTPGGVAEIASALELPLNGQVTFWPRLDG